LRPNFIKRRFKGFSLGKQPRGCQRKVLLEKGWEPPSLRRKLRGKKKKRPLLGKTVSPNFKKRVKKRRPPREKVLMSKNWGNLSRPNLRPFKRGPKGFP